MRAFVVGLALLTAACGSPDAPAGAKTPGEIAEAPSLDADLVVPTAEEAVHLDDHRGRVLVMQLAAADANAAWAALADASPDLQMEGATLLGIVTEGALRGDHPFTVRHADGLAWADALDFTGLPLVVVVGPDGRLRGRHVAPSADEIVVLAAPVLLEAEDAATRLLPTALTAATVEAMVRAGAALIDVRAAGPPLANALAVPLGQLRADVLPPDVGSDVVFVGPDAEAAAALATSWGYDATHALVDPTGLAEAAPIDALPVYDERDDLPRVRG